MPRPGSSRLVLVTGLAAIALAGTALVGHGLATAGEQGPEGRTAPSPTRTTDEPPESPYDAAIRELDCPPDDQQFWMTDSSQPPRGIDVDEALALYLDRWDGRRTGEVRGEYGGFAVVLAGGRVVEVVDLQQWPNGSWSVEGGQGCRRTGRA